LERIESFERGILEGRSRQWYADGRWKADATYGGGRLDGEQIEWYDDGTVRVRRTWRSGCLVNERWGEPSFDAIREDILGLWRTRRAVPASPVSVEKAVRFVQTGMELDAVRTMLGGWDIEGHEDGLRCLGYYYGSRDDRRLMKVMVGVDGKVCKVVVGRPPLAFVD
jgi:hypothetical protein